MKVILPDNRKATVIGEGPNKMSKIKLENGAEAFYPTDKLKPAEAQPQQEELKMVIIPAIDRLEELRGDMMSLNLVGAKVSESTKIKYDRLFTELSKEAEADLIKKWGL